MEMNHRQIKRVVTHSTVFHADDVFGVAMWKLINPKIEVIRTLKPEDYVGDDTIIFDIGLGKYDHHQEDKAMRPAEPGKDPVPYCGFGLLWRDYGYLLCPEKEAWKRVDNTLVLSIDKADNGIQQNMLSTSIKAMNPNWNAVETEDDAFLRAMHVAMTILKAHVDQANSAVAAKDLIMASFEYKEVLVLDKYLPWTDTVLGDERLKDILFVVYPSLRGGWNVQTVPKAQGCFSNRMDFPKEWLGHADPERGIHFAHTSNFLIACDTKDQAIKVAEEAVQEGLESSQLVYSV